MSWDDVKKHLDESEKLCDEIEQILEDINKLLEKIQQRIRVKNFHDRTAIDIATNIVGQHLLSKMVVKRGRKNKV